MTKRSSSRRRSRSFALGLCAVLVVTALAACGGDDDDDAAPAVSATPTVSCPAPQTTTTAGAQRTVTSNGEQRTYNVWLPTGYTGTEPVPLVLDFHGAGGEAVSYATTFSPMSVQAPARGYLLVAPQAVVGSAAGIGWKSTPAGTPNDVQFVTDLLADLAKNYCVDPQRQYATGFSSGSGFTTYLSCMLDVWGAVAPLAGVNLTQPCVNRPPMPVVTFHGVADDIVPYASTVPATIPDPDGFYLGDVETVVDQFAARNGCRRVPVDTEVVATVTKRTYEGCTADTVLYSIDYADHTYPGGPKVSEPGTAELSGQSQAIDAGKTILDFFDAHPRTTPPVPTPAAWAPAAAPPATADAAAGAPDATPTITLTP